MKPNCTQPTWWNVFAKSCNISAKIHFWFRSRGLTFFHCYMYKVVAMHASLPYVACKAFVTVRFRNSLCAFSFAVFCSVEMLLWCKMIAVWMDVIKNNHPFLCSLMWEIFSLNDIKKEHNFTAYTLRLAILIYLQLNFSTAFFRSFCLIFISNTIASWISSF